ncbi:LysR family transcriptional regulator [Rhodobacterales bacterium]|nr:LysR family transcriptional regulator [Rhodobacterales bacterium]
MDISRLPLNALRAFEASARLLSFTRAGLELRVSQTAISHQVRSLEQVLGVTLFERQPRGVTLTDEGHALLPVLSDAFRRMGAVLSRFEDGNFREVLTVGAVGTFATGWLLPRLQAFSSANPQIDLRLKTNNNRADLLADGLDCFIRFGDGAWHGTEAVRLFDAPLSPVCAPELAATLSSPEDLAAVPLLRSYRMDEWALWFRAAGLQAAPAARGWMFDSSITMVDAAVQGAGAALVPVAMFSKALADRCIVRPFQAEVTTGAYWLSWLKSRGETAAMGSFRMWIEKTIAEELSGSDRPAASG